MRILSECLACNNTKTVCPLLTRATNDDDDSPGCEYNNWAYALFAVVAFIIVGIPFVAFICCLQRRIRSKKRARGRTRSVSHESSSPYPYQPIYKEAGHANYGAMAENSSVDEQAVRSPSHDSTSTLGDRLSQHPETTSVASSRASMIPTYDDVSLGQRNALIASRTRHPSDNTEAQRGGNSQPAPKKKQRRSSRLSSDSQEKGVDQPGQFYDSVDVVTNVPKIQKQTVHDSKDQNQAPPKPPRQLVNGVNGTVTEEPVYSVLEGSEPEGASQPPSHGIMDPEVSAPSAVHEGVKASDGADGSSGNGGGGSPEYAILDPSTEVHDNDEDQTQDSENEQRDQTPSSPPDNQYLPILPPTPPEEVNEPSSEKQALLESSGSHNFDQYPVTPKEVSKSRTDFEEFLLGKVRDLPASERNGVFLIRNSISSTGSKVLTMYCWKSDSNKELYNFKINSTEEGQAFLHRSSKKFSDLNRLLEYLREHKDMLPCVLTTQVFP